MQPTWLASPQGSESLAWAESSFEPASHGLRQAWWSFVLRRLSRGFQ